MVTDFFQDLEVKSDELNSVNGSLLTLNINKTHRNFTLPYSIIYNSTTCVTALV